MKIVALYASAFAVALLVGFGTFALMPTTAQAGSAECCSSVIHCVCPAPTGCDCPTGYCAWVSSQEKWDNIEQKCEGDCPVLCEGCSSDCSPNW